MGLTGNVELHAGRKMSRASSTTMSSVGAYLAGGRRQRRKLDEEDRICLLTCRRRLAVSRSGAAFAGYHVCRMVSSTLLCS